ncbi:hypothetical protein K2173_028495 [Erythroxylum novogranatense]|uniref:Tesmin/TSO1-like CXC domain-containing protein n=1 Tax=Erythroxylum novogranatense TaxID=1862640 RepID=A0AAV8U4U3_9ROSI|nr:hypothetical protein K2173_028495 [Erythroxylum novogranatense]
MKKPNHRSKPASPSGSSDDRKQQHHEKRVCNLEKENEALKREIEELKSKLASSSPNSVDRLRKQKDGEPQKLSAIEEQVVELQKKLNAHFQLSSQKQKRGESGKPHQDEIQRLKVQKVELLCKIKLQSVQFRLSKALLEKEVLQLKKEQRRNAYEMRKLLAQNQRQKLVLQRKTEEASVVTKRLKQMLEARKALSQKVSGNRDGSPGVQGFEIELKIAERVEEIRSEFERQMEEMADEVRKYEEEAEMLREENLRYLLQEKEVDCVARDSELKDLKDEVVRLSSLVGQLRLPKALVVIRNPQIELVKSLSPVESSMGSTDLRSSGSEYSGCHSNVVDKSTPVACCSCTKRSLCKTTKCECRAVGSCCGASCGCATSKCRNREGSATKTDGSLQHVVQDSVLCSETMEMEKTALVSQDPDLDKDSGAGRKPLREIGGTLMNKSSAQSDQEIRVQKPVVQLDNAADSYLQTADAVDSMKVEKVIVAEVPKRLTRGKRSKRKSLVKKCDVQ